MTAPPANPVREQLRQAAEALQAVSGMHRRLVRVWLWAWYRRRDPVPDLARAWFGGFELGPGAWEAARGWSATLERLAAEAGVT